MKNLLKSIALQVAVSCVTLAGCSRDAIKPTEPTGNPASTASTSSLDATAGTADVRGVFAGGPLYKSGYATNISEIRNSGLNTVIVWTIHIDANGNLNLNQEFPICTNGAWVGNATYPDFANTMAQLKTAPTSVNRIEICIIGASNGSFTNIKNLTASQGTGTTSMLYKNFNALKQAVPAITVVDFDDEDAYDNTSSKSFAYMLGTIGYKISVCPYTNQPYWNTLVTQINQTRPGLVDRVYLQCYDGGAYNNPCNWNVGGVPLYPGLWGGSAHQSPSQVQTTLANWKSCISGAWMWIYDDFIGSAAPYNTAIVNSLGSEPIDPADITSSGTITAQYTDSPTGEDITKLVDNSSSTKYLTFHSSGWMQFKATSAAIVKRYTLTSANDAPERDPKNWTLQGSNNGTNWTTLDTQINQTFASRFLKKSYTFTNTTAYTYYRLNVSAVGNGTTMQLAELELLTK